MEPGESGFPHHCGTNLGSGQEVGQLVQIGAGIKENGHIAGQDVERQEGESVTEREVWDLERKRTLDARRSH